MTALGNVADGHRQPLLDGTWGGAVSTVAWVGRGHFLPESVRARIRESVSLGREGFGFWRSWRRDVWEVEGLTLDLPPGVFRAWELSAELAEAGLAAIKERNAPIVIDVGTGSGAVALLIAKSRPDAFVAGTDLSSRAISAARRNRVKASLETVRFANGSLLDPLPDAFRSRVDLLVSNVPCDPPSVRGSSGDPRRTLIGQGADGLDLARLLASQAVDFLVPGGRLVIMLRPWQSTSVLPEFESLGFRKQWAIPCSVRAHEFLCLEWRGVRN